MTDNWTTDNEKGLIPRRKNDEMRVNAPSA
jgi:hypothetical protein